MAAEARLEKFAKLCPCGCTSFCRAKGKATAGILRKSAATVKFFKAGRCRYCLFERYTPDMYAAA